MTDNLEHKQIEREKIASTSGYNKFQKAEQDHKSKSNGINTTFGLMVKKHQLGAAIEYMEDAISMTKTCPFQKQVSTVLQ